MAGNSVPQEPRSRHACESCRRRKARCPAERPVCSLCQRSGQRCVYLPRNQSRSEGRVDKVPRKASKDRVQNIESQISDIYAILQSLTNPTTATSPDHARADQDHGSGRGSIHAEASSGTGLTDWVDLSTTALTQPDPSEELLEHAMRVYRTKVHLQPLPLFSMQDLSHHLSESSPFLRYSFLALCLNLCPPTFSTGLDADAGQQYSRLGHEAVVRLAFEGTATLEVLEALCLLALNDMIVGKPARAWMSIGTASKLQAFRTLSGSESVDAPRDEERTSRCYWSIFILERAFAHQPGARGHTHNAPDCPPGGPAPSMLVPSHDGQDVGGRSGDEGVKDPSILTTCIDFISLWGDVSSYLHELRSGKTEAPWSPNSTSTRLRLQLLDSEARISSRHMLRNVAFPSRSAAELLEHQEYWTPWVFMQIACHAVPAILNHPFIHLVTTRDNNRIPTSRIFLQSTVDMALYNAGWVARLLRMFDLLPFEIYNPLIGHMVAGTATVLWFFQFARDSTTSRKAKEDLNKCERFLEHMSMKWPHIAQKLQLLQDLQAQVQDGRNEGHGASTTVTFRPSVIFALLDSSVPRMAQVDLPRTAPENGTSDGDAASMRLNVHFVHPLVENQDEGPLSSVNSAEDEILHAGIDSFDTFHDDFFSQFTCDESQWSLALP